MKWVVGRRCRGSGHNWRRRQQTHSIQSLSINSKNQINLICWLMKEMNGFARWAASRLCFLHFIHKLKFIHSVLSASSFKKSIHSSTIPLLKNGCFFDFANYCYNTFHFFNNQWNENSIKFIWLNWLELIELLLRLLHWWAALLKLRSKRLYVFLPGNSIQFLINPISSIILSLINQSQPLSLLPPHGALRS